MSDNQTTDLVPRRLDFGMRMKAPVYEDEDDSLSSQSLVRRRSGKEPVEPRSVRRRVHSPVRGEGPSGPAADATALVAVPAIDPAVVPATDPA